MDAPLQTDSPEWHTRSEQVDTGQHLSGVPFYAIPGNHNNKNSSIEAQLKYVEKGMGSNRRRMPGTYDFPDSGKAGDRLSLQIRLYDTAAGTVAAYPRAGSCDQGVPACLKASAK